MGSIAQQIVKSETVPLPLPLLVRKIAADPYIPLLIWEHPKFTTNAAGSSMQTSGEICRSHSARQYSLLLYNSSLLKTPPVWIHFMFDELKMCDSGFMVRNTRWQWYTYFVLSISSIYDTDVRLLGRMGKFQAPVSSV
jgi:hypothetical protein